MVNQNGKETHKSKQNARSGRGATVILATSASQGHSDDRFHKFSIPKCSNLEKPKYKPCKTPLGFQPVALRQPVPSQANRADIGNANNPKRHPRAAIRHTQYAITPTVDDVEHRIDVDNRL